MAFNWKEKLQKGKEKAADAFAKATIKGEELLDQAEKAATEFGKDVKAKVEELKKPEAPAANTEASKKAAPKNAPKNG